MFYPRLHATYTAYIRNDAFLFVSDGDGIDDEPRGVLRDNIQFINKTFDPVTLYVKLKGVGVIDKVGEGEIIVPANGQSEGVFFVKLHESRLEGYKTRIDIIFTNSQGVELERKTNFLGPATSTKK